MKSTKEYIELLKEFKNKEAGHYATSRYRDLRFCCTRSSKQRRVTWMCKCKSVPQWDCFVLESLKNTLEQLFGCRVDIVRLRDHVNAFLRERIEKEGIYV